MQVPAPSGSDCNGQPAGPGFVARPGGKEQPWYMDQTQYGL